MLKEGFYLTEKDRNEHRQSIFGHMVECISELSEFKSNMPTATTINIFLLFYHILAIFTAVFPLEFQLHEREDYK